VLSPLYSWLVHFAWNYFSYALHLRYMLFFFLIKKIHSQEQLSKFWRREASWYAGFPMTS
jgi:hypothetical protein